MKLETIIYKNNNNYTQIIPIDNIELFKHCLGVDIGSNYNSFCSVNEYKDEVKPLLKAHGISKFEMTTTVNK